MYVDNEKKKKKKSHKLKKILKRKKDSTFTFGGGVRLREFQSSNSLLLLSNALSCDYWLSSQN